MTTYVSVEYRVGWVDTKGKWHVLTYFPASATLEEAEADLEPAKAWCKRPGIVAEVRHAARQGRIEVRTRTITRTSWEVPS